MDMEIFKTYRTKIRIKGKQVLIGWKESEEIYNRHVFRGGLGRKGVPRKNLSLAERLILEMRARSSAHRWNHEWWGAFITQPEWFNRMQKDQGHWLYIPRVPEELTLRWVCKKIGYEIGLEEMKWDLTQRSKKYRQAIKKEMHEQASRTLEPQERRKLKVVVAGYENLDAAFDAQFKRIVEARILIHSMIATVPWQEYTECLDGFSDGHKAASKENIQNCFSDFNERAELTRIFEENYHIIDKLNRRAEIAEFVIKNLPPRMQERYKKEDSAARLGFIDRLRHSWLDKYKIACGSRGRPKKMEK